MKALRLSENGLELAEIERPADPSEALVRVVRSGICNTDLELVRGYAGFAGTIGHEFVGVVERSDDQPHLEGRRVVGEINAGCGHCDVCRGGDPRHCQQRTVLGIHGRDGAHAEYLQLPSRNLVEVPDNISDDQAVFVEPLAAAFGITESVNIPMNAKVAVVGDGKLGILCARSISTMVHSVALIGKHQEKIAIGSGPNIEGIVVTDVPGDFHRTFDFVVEASGSASGFKTALDLVRPRGTIILKSTFKGQSEFDASRIVVDEIKLIGSRCGRFAGAIGLLEKGAVKVDDLISERYKLTEGVDAISRASQPGVLKVLLTM